MGIDPAQRVFMRVSAFLQGRLTYTNKWELVYPTGFFHRLALEALTSIARLHAQNKTSPFEAYSQGTYWLPEFNESES